MFFRYKYETSVSHSTGVNSTESILPCLSNQSMIDADVMPDSAARTGIWHIHCDGNVNLLVTWY